MTSMTALYHHCLLHNSTVETGSLLKGMWSKGKRPRISILLPCFYFFTFKDSNLKPSNHESASPPGCCLPAGVCDSGLLEKKSAYGLGKKVLSFRTVVTLNKCELPVFSQPSGECT